MGYYETVCQLCGVSFAIARLRRADEPREAAWCYYGSEYVEADGDFDQSNELCGENSGCTELVPEELDGEGDLGEHLSGPGCTSRQGYSGQRISLDEMKGCRAVQCILKKGKDWLPEPDDQDFELESDYFLTGVGDGSPDEAPLRDIKPERHGVGEVMIDNLYTGNDDDLGWGLPFHPTCFEIFKKVSILRLGNVDIEGLWKWRELDTYEGFFEKFPRDFAVRNAHEQWWSHDPGAEYLVANPIQILSLASLINKVGAYGEDIVFGQKNTRTSNQSDTSNEPMVLKPRSSDPFETLPAEVACMVTDCLSSKDIASLRLATRYFRQLPRAIFRRLLFEDMPWFWEAEHLSVADTNWYLLYRQVQSCWSNFKGLMNRKRIWKDVEEIVRKLEKIRDSAKIVAA